MKRGMWKLTLGLLAALVLIVLGSGPLVLAEEKTEILIGTNLPMTGILAGVGVEQKWSYEQAVKDINDQGGILVQEYGKKLPVKLIVADDESNAGKAGKAVERLIKVDKVDLLLGGFAAPFGVIPG
ncbi:MAG: ABC transporter substrate-binding protein, partial [Thermodesulfobacteriota bacterium]